MCLCGYTLLVTWKWGGNSRISKSISTLAKELEDTEIVNGINEDLFNDFVRICKTPNIFIWCSRLQICEILDWFKENTDTNMDVLVWNKTNPLPKNCNWLSDIEYCLVFSKNAKYNSDYKYKSKWYTSAINQSDKKKYLHPTIKPIELVKRHLLNATKENDIVLDCFMGSGTTCKACQEIGRRYIGIEINETFYNIAKDRLNNIDQRGNVSLF